MEEFNQKMAMIIFFSLLLPLLLLLLLLRRRSSGRRLPPSPPGLPLIGHLHHLLLSPMPHHTLASLATKLNTHILYLRLGRVPTIVVSSPRLAREVLKTHDHSLASRPQLLSAQYLSFGCSDVTFSPYGPYWRMARRICVTELLSAKRVSSFRHVRNEEVGHMIRAVSAAAPKPADMSQLFFELANNVLCRVAFGRRFDEEGGGSSKKRLAEVLEETQALFAGFDVSEFFPGMGWMNKITGLTKRLEKNLADLRAVCDEIIGEHMQQQQQKGEKEDFVDVLLRVQKSGDLEVPLTDDNLKALVLDMFVAGTDTTSASLEWVMTELSRHPKVMEKAQAEVRKIPVGNDRDIEEDDLQHLRYVKAVVKETLRVHPPVPLLVPRESIEDCVIDGYTIPAKSRVLVNTYAMGRDPETWDNPLEFRPERFDIDGEDIDIKGQDFALLPFGGGRRGCPGYSFALATLDLALARLLYHFDWELPQGVKAEDVNLEEVFGLATRKKTPLILVPTKVSAYHAF